jgi:hypothetical protein
MDRKYGALLNVDIPPWLSHVRRVADTLTEFGGPDIVNRGLCFLLATSCRLSVPGVMAFGILGDLTTLCFFLHGRNRGTEETGVNCGENLEEI